MTSTAPISPDFYDPAYAAPDVPPGAWHAPWRVRVLSPHEFAALAPAPGRMSRAQLEYLAWLDLLAPTAHNSVPQRFRLHEEDAALGIWVDREFVLSASDETGRQALVSLGCGIANATLGARCYGLEAQLTLAPGLDGRVRPLVSGEPRYAEVGRLHFRPGAATLDGAWIEAMRKRKVVRAEYDERVKLGSALVERLRAAVAVHHGLELHLVVDSPTLHFFAKFQEAADTMAFNREAFAVELGAWLGPNDQRAHLGMRGIEFGLSDAVSGRIHRGLLHGEALLPSDIAEMAKAGYRGMRSASAVAVVTAEEDSAALRIAAGRAYEELALVLVQHGLSTAVHAAMVEYEPANLALRARLRTRGRPTVIFRIGRPLHDRDGQRPHSVRPTLESLFLQDDDARRGAGAFEGWSR